MAVDQILEQLREEEEKLLEQADEISEHLKIKKAEIKGIQAAIKALGQKPGTKLAKKNSRPTVNKRDVIEAIEQALLDETPMELEALKEAVQSSIAETGKSMQGFALRFSEAIRDCRFVDSPAGYRFSDESQSSVAFPQA